MVVLVQIGPLISGKAYYKILGFNNYMERAVLVAEVEVATGYLHAIGCAACALRDVCTWPSSRTCDFFERVDDVTGRGSARVSVFDHRSESGKNPSFDLRPFFASSFDL